jgi:hypothetical protein
MEHREHVSVLGEQSIDAGRLAGLGQQHCSSGNTNNDFALPRLGFAIHAEPLFHDWPQQQRGMGFGCYLGWVRINLRHARSRVLKERHHGMG